MGKSSFHVLRFTDPSPIFNDMSDDLKLQAYCVRCKAQLEMAAPTPVFTKKGQPAVQGQCSVCGTKMFRMGRVPQHAEMQPPPKPAPPPPTGKLVIVESPTKARTVGRFLGKGYTVKASVGHIRDLLRSQLSVDVENDFTPKYRIPNEKRSVVKELTTIAAKSAEVYLATDPDREGEAIAWHLYEVLGLEPEKVRRVEFHEITDSAVEEAFAHPRAIDMHLVDAQQARRVLDRLVGYNLSPLLWRKIRSRLSAGRVQSVALRIIVEREREIQQFEPVEYWTLDALLKPQKNEGRRRAHEFKARLVKVRGEDVPLSSEADVTPLLAELEQAIYEVSKVKAGQRTRNALAPYTTSTMQQEATRKLGLTAQKAMHVAQELYEGLNVGNGQPVGLITYMRTDSTNIAPVAQQEARTFIAERYGAEYLPPAPPTYKTRAKAAQEAHEAIRPTSVLRTPESLKDYLSRDQFRLYDLIWRRFVASQMAAALYDTLTVEIAAGTAEEKPFLFRASGSTLRFPGFLVVYEESNGDNGAEEEKSQPLPHLEEGDPLDLVRLLPEQHFTQPPPRYTDATLIRTLEEYGIGRPSTYAVILSTILQRGYVAREKRRYYPTDTGFLVNDMLVEQFADLINVDFTAQMETQLDEIAEGERDWVALMREFYGPFTEALEKADAALPKVVQVEYIGRACPECGGQLLIRWGKYGKFVGCSNFPTCRYTEPWLERIGVKCPTCGEGDVVVKRTKKGRTFYGCSRWPDCEYTSWNRPVAAPCPTCGGVLYISKPDTAACPHCHASFPLETLEAVGEKVAAEVG